MKYAVEILSDAEDDVDNAFTWYELQQTGLGKIFYKSIDSQLLFCKNPLSF